MNHIALYRKYRPTTFKDVIGQEHIVTTLKNQILADKVSHAYLFTGSRGTGKTTFARIFARSINCQKATDGSACGKCAPCIALSNPTNIDILEIDAASNNKVDEMREIRERVKYLPVNGRYKVYIVDEVHMLTDAAFNALLKTLEEPPSHVIFILATTEAHKLPATILSRCMRFDFRLVPKKQLVELISKVLKNEKKDAELTAIDYIADAAGGSFRDALSILDMCMHGEGKKITLAGVLASLGATSKEHIAEFVNFIANGDLSGTFLKIEEFSASGKSMGLIASNVAAFARDCLALKAGMDKLVLGTKESVEKLKIIADITSDNLLLYILTEFAALDSELKYATNPRLVLETMALRVARQKANDVAMLASRIEKLESYAIKFATTSNNDTGNLQSVSGQQIDNSEAIKKTKLQKAITSNVPLEPAVDNGQMAFSLPVQKIADAVSQALDEDAKSVWGRLITYFRKKSIMHLYALFSEFNDYKLVGRELVITAGDDHYLRFCDLDAAELIRTALVEIEAPFSLKVEKAKKSVDMDKEIARIEKLAGFKPKVIK